ncbi:interleukin-4 receptor subunit alpha [Dipodomys spectabilis]|uniref:interleukin-4 receptor subunit alpha n=1 Tax=Dipodomys spectabilis TaxID=105255 RepID=UPI001C53D7A5|nr:interleukin-4 receptor subunit alpha [Dipodomys spectabilis]
MGRLRRALLPLSCLVLVWAAGSGGVRVLHPPSCSSDYLSASTCEWRLDRPLNCTARLRLAYWLSFLHFENRSCVPHNTAGAACACHLLTDNVIVADTYRLDLWAGRRLLWGGSFTPSKHVKPRAPENVTVSANISHMWVVAWSNPYPPGNLLHGELTYQVNVSQADDPAQCQVYNVTYTEPVLHLAASTLQPGLSYRARVRALAQNLHSSWSEWSPSVTWHNHSQLALEQQLALGVGIACTIILLVCLVCYFSVIKIKQLWWDQIPNPGRSTLLAVVIQDSQVSPWEKPMPGQEAPERPRWRSCLAKLLPCLLEHGGKTRSFPKASRSEARLAWPPVELHKMILWPERISVVRCVELCEAPAARAAVEQEPEEEEAAGPAGAPAEGSAGAFPGGVVARLAESLFLDLLGAEAGPAGSPGPPAGWARAPEPAAAVADNPAYRRFSEGCAPAEPGGWEHVLRQRLLQTAAAPAGAYRDLKPALEPGAGYKALPGAPADPGYRPCRAPGRPEPPAGAGADELGGGLAYAALTCHQCGRLKQRRGPAERAPGPGAARPCCACCSGDPASPPGTCPGRRRAGHSLLPASVSPGGKS